MVKSRLGSSSFRVLAAAGLSALMVVVVAGSLLAPAGAQTKPSAGAGSKIAAIKACAEKAGITVNSLADLKQLSTDQRNALKQCLTSNGVNFGGPKIAAIKACAEKAGITVNSLADLKQLSTDQRNALKQCLTSNGVNFGGPKIAAIKACAEKAGITVNSLADLKQLSTDQIAALKQCVLGSRSSGTI